MARADLALEVESGYVHLAIAADDGSSRDRGIVLARPWPPELALPQSRFRRSACRPQSGRPLAAAAGRRASIGDSLAFPFSYWRRDGHGWGGQPASGLAFRVSPEQTATSAPHVLEPWERPTTRGFDSWRSAPQEATRIREVHLRHPAVAHVRVPRHCGHRGARNLPRLRPGQTSRQHLVLAPTGDACRPDASRRPRCRHVRHRRTLAPRRRNPEQLPSTMSSRDRSSDPRVPYLLPRHPRRNLGHGHGRTSAAAVHDSTAKMRESGA